MKRGAEIDLFYKNWCKETKRNGGILIGSSIKELLLAFRSNGELEKLNHLVKCQDEEIDNLMSCHFKLQQGKWIDVKKRKPKMDKKVLVWVDDDFEGFPAIAWWTGGSWYMRFKTIKVSHWMQLPKRPSMGQNDKRSVATGLNSNSSSC